MRVFLLTLCLGISLFASAHSPLKLTIYTESALELQKIEKGELTGFAVELVRLILANSKLQGEIQLVPWARAYKYALNQRNVLLFSTRRTPQREHLFVWARPLFPDGFAPWYDSQHFALICRKKSSLQTSSLAQAKRYVLGVQRSGYSEEFARHTLLWPDDKLAPSKNFADSFFYLQKGKIDLLLTSETEWQTIVRRHQIEPDLFKVCLDVNFKHSPFYFTFSLDTAQALVEAFNQGFDTLLQQGQYRQLYQQWDQKH